jgi:small subunit ribosomal protein S14
MKYKLVFDKQRRKLFKTKEIKRTCLKIGVRLKNKLKLFSIIKLSNLNKNSTLSKIRNRCSITGRSQAVYRKLSISRIKLRELVLHGLQIGFKKSSW